MLPVRTLCPTYDPSEYASRPNQVQAMTIRRIGKLVIYYPHAIEWNANATLIKT